jgi:cyclin-A
MLDISARSYEHREMVECEMLVSNTLSFRLTGITAAHFLDHFLKVAQLNPKQEAFAKYLCDLALLDYSFVGILPSLVAASVIHLTRQTTVKCKGVEDIWTPSLRFYTKYESRNMELRSTVRKLRRAHFTAWDGTFSAVRRKYQAAEYFHASELLCISESDLKF